MPIEQIGGWEHYGLPGLVIAALFAFVLFLVSEHKAERLEWLSAYKDQSKSQTTVQTETNEVIRELTAVIRELNARRRGND